MFCQVLLPQVDRYLDPIYRRASRTWEISQLDKATGLEISTLVNCPGVSMAQARTMMKWPYYMTDRVEEVAEMFRDEALAALSPREWTDYDGFCFLRCMVEEGAKGKTVPMWATMWIQSRIRLGMTYREVAAVVGHGVTAQQVWNWGHGDHFEALTGRQRGKAGI